MKAIIIGAGIGGVTAGIALEQAGMEVEIYERVPDLKAVGAGLSLWSNAFYAFDQIGIGDKIRAYGTPAPHGGIHSWQGDDLVASTSSDLGQVMDNIPMVVHRVDLQNVLLDAFKGKIHYGKSLQTYSQNAESAFVHFDTGEIEQADMLIAADGIHSPVRLQMFPQSKPRYAGYTAWRGVANFDHQRVGKMWGESWGYGKRFGIAPLKDNRVYWFACQNIAESWSMPADEQKQYLLESFGDWHNPIADLITETDAQAILHHNISDIAPLKSWTDGRVALLGDSAHAMTPNMGQGACQAVEDAVVMGKIFRGSSDVLQALQDYEQARIERANGVLKTSRMIGNMGQIQNRLLADLRNFVVRHLPSDLQTKNLMEVVSYRV